MTPDQTDFTEALLRPDLPHPDNLIDHAGRPAGKRFDIYRNNVVFSLCEALVTAFPVLHKLLGDQFFSAMAGIFVRQHQPETPVLMFYGAQMPEFLTTFEPAQKYPYLADVARLELAMRHSYHAADIEPFDPQIFSTLPADQLMASRVTLAPSLQLLRSRWPIYSIWASQMQGTPMPEAPSGEALIITRAEFDPAPHLLPAGGATFVMALQAGETFGSALDKATAAVADFDLQTTLGLLIAGQAIATLTTEKHDA
ncbi:putative DNA-binding domain-containing protein [Cognatishimia sp.]|uniref:HvfC/BufC family peptide modification chaperone n=1 Tax=Cognatishimia sp. TaxID=2211648 RepID=UPI003511B170